MPQQGEPPEDIAWQWHVLLMSAAFDYVGPAAPPAAGRTTPTPLPVEPGRPPALTALAMRWNACGKEEGGKPQAGCRTRDLGALKTGHGRSGLQQEACGLHVTWIARTPHMHAWRKLGNVHVAYPSR